MGDELTQDEANAVLALRRLARRWPKRLGLFSASGSLHVIRLDENGDKRRVGEGVDPASVIETISGIPNDGGDW